MNSCVDVFILEPDILCPNSGEVIWTSVKLPNGEELRYRTNFIELRLIGNNLHFAFFVQKSLFVHCPILVLLFLSILFTMSGGFGVVAECENKLDKKVYTVKKISLKAANMSFQKILRYNIQFPIHELQKL